MSFKKFPDIIKQINTLPLSDQEAINHLFEYLHPTYALQKELLEYLFDIRARDEIDIGRILAEISSFITDDKLQREEKWQKVRNFLRQKRFPLLTKAERIFEKRLAEINLPDGCKIIPPLYWEDNKYELKIKFTNSKQLTETLQKILYLSQTQPWQELFDEKWFEELFAEEDIDR